MVGSSRDQWDMLGLMMGLVAIFDHFNNGEDVSGCNVEVGMGDEWRWKG